MNALAPPPSLRLVPVVGDGMDPTLRPHRDFALCQPVHAYQGEGIYLLSDVFGGQDFFRVDATPQGRMRLMRDNPLYRGREVSLTDFEERVLAIVVADVRGRTIAQRSERLQ